MTARLILLIPAILVLTSGSARAIEPVRSARPTMDILERITSGKFVLPLRRINRNHVKPAQSPRAVPSSAPSSARYVPMSRSTDMGRLMHLRPPRPPAATNEHAPRSGPTVASRAPKRKGNIGFQPIPSSLDQLLGGPVAVRGRKRRRAIREPRVRAKAVFCVDNKRNRVVIARNIKEPLPIASITKLLTAMVVIDRMNLSRVLRVPKDIRRVPRHRVGLRSKDLLTVGDILHGLLIESGNDCAEVLARAYPRGGRAGFISEMNRRARQIGATKTRILTPSGLDMKISVGRKGGRNLIVRKPNLASAQDVATIAQHAFRYPLIRRISRKKKHTIRTLNKRPRTYKLATNDKLLLRKLPVAGAKTGYTDTAGKCIVALFKDDKQDYTVVVLNTRRHFRAAERIYRWASKTF